MSLTPAQPEVICQTAHWLVVNKPGGWHSVRLAGRDPDRAAESLDAPVLQDWLERQFPELAGLRESGLVQRLDCLTSGCVIVGRSESAITRLRDAVRELNGGVAKTYLAMVEGIAGQGAFDLFFRSRYRRSRKISVSETGADSERGRCRWRVRERLADRTMLEVDLLGPGRRHQIRAGLAHLGHPLLGDRLYGGRDWNGRLGLHAWRVIIDGQTVTAPTPVQWQCI